MDHYKNAHTGARTHANDTYSEIAAETSSAFFLRRIFSSFLSLFIFLRVVDVVVVGVVVCWIFILLFIVNFSHFRNDFPLFADWCARINKLWSRIIMIQSHSSGGTKAIKCISKCYIKKSHAHRIKLKIIIYSNNKNHCRSIVGFYVSPQVFLYLFSRFWLNRWVTEIFCAKTGKKNKQKQANWTVFGNWRRRDLGNENKINPVQRHCSSFDPIWLSFRHDLKLYSRLVNAQTDDCHLMTFRVVSFVYDSISSSCRRRRNGLDWIGKVERGIVSRLNVRRRTLLLCSNLETEARAYAWRIEEHFGIVGRVPEFVRRFYSW